MQKIIPFLWFDNQAEEAANFYVSIFKNSQITAVARYPEAGKEIHRREPGSVMSIGFTLDGVEFSAINGGPVMTFSPATSFVINCETQDEVNHFWDKLGTGGQIQQCGWLTDKFGVTWQITPTILPKLLMDKDRAKAERVMAAMMQMIKLDIKKLQEA